MSYATQENKENRERIKQLLKYYTNIRKILAVYYAQEELFAQQMQNRRVFSSSVNEDDHQFRLLMEKGVLFDHSEYLALRVLEFV